MELESVSLRLPRDLLSGAQRVATARDVTVGHLVRQLLKREVERQVTDRKTDEVDKALLAALKELLAHDLVEASSWENLAERLKPHGYDLRKDRGCITLYKSSCGTRICKGADLGFSDATLVERFGSTLPNPPISKTHLGTMPAGRIDPTRHAILSRHISTARSWPDLINRLAIEGMELRPLGAGLGIHMSGTGRHLCNSTTVGARYKTLVIKYGAPMPGHPYDVSEYLEETGNQRYSNDRN